ncbi:MAG: hypothetical protein P8Y97_01130 [Candidatus Lokiarchaeota archaeon]
MVKVKYPPHKMKEIIEIYTSGKAAKYPEYVNRKYQWVAPDYDIRIYNIYEIPDEKLVEGLKGIAKRFSTYITVKGYKYKIEMLMEGAEAIKMMK